MPKEGERGGDSLRINRSIRAPEVRLISETGEALGIVSIQEALAAAERVSLDLVEVSPKAEPPVCKIMNYGKFRYEQQKKKNESKKNQKIVDIKEVQVRPGIDKHDLEVKMKAALKFLSNGDKVKFTMRFRGREISHQALGLEILNRIVEETSSIAKLDMPPKLEGKQYLMILAPLPKPTAQKGRVEKVAEPKEEISAESVSV